VSLAERHVNRLESFQTVATLDGSPRPIDPLRMKPSASSTVVCGALGGLVLILSGPVACSGDSDASTRRRRCYPWSVSTPSPKAHVHGPNCNHDHEPAVSQEPVRKVARPGRNEPCHCGSGKKYKKCHFLADEAGS
jgi:hypothetical protein